jgi:hypothetical protein
MYQHFAKREFLVVCFVLSIVFGDLCFGCLVFVHWGGGRIDGWVKGNIVLAAIDVMC